MPVYMIRAGENGPVKIGHSHDPEIRLGQLQVSHWETLRIIRLFEGGEVEEAALHAQFDDLHIRGEWHSFSKLMLGDVGLVEIAKERVEADPLPPEVVMDATRTLGLGQRLLALRKSRGLTQAELSAELGVSRQFVTMIERGHDLPGRELLWRMSRFFGVPFVEFSPANTAVAA